MKNAKWKKSCLFLIPLENGQKSVGQILDVPRGAMGAVLCGFFLGAAARNQKVEVGRNLLISVLFITPDYLDSGRWEILGAGQAIPADEFIDIKQLAAKDFVGMKVYGAGIAEKFINACYGLYPWNGFYREDYLDNLLLAGVSRPALAVFK